MQDGTQDFLEGAISEPVEAKLLREVFQHHDLFSKLSSAALEALAGSAERIFVSGGAKILGKGSVAGAALVVEHGRVRCDWGLERAMLGDLGRGDVFGLGSVIGHRPMSGSVIALRDTRLIRLRANQLLRIVSEHSELLRAYSRWHHDVALRSHGMGSARNFPKTFAVLQLGDDPALARAQTLLCASFRRIAGAAVVVDESRVRQVLGSASSSSVDFDLAPVALLDWCESQEAAGSCLFFSCDSSDTAWTRWCLRQTDKIVVIVHAGTDIDVAELDRRITMRLSAGHSPVQVSLVIVQDGAVETPRATRRWLGLSCLRGLHHVRLDEPRDFDRAARRLGERATGVVLGGGGARGFAHVGVLQALEEAGIAVDHVGGTSMGAIIGAAYARGWAPKQILEIIGGITTRSRAVIDPDFPMVAMLSGRKLDAMLRSLFGDMDVSDLWLPFYAVSSSLTRSRMVVHDRGPVWKVLRASASLPGVFPPVLIEDQLYVDGAVVNNVPMDVMGARCGEGTVIAVDVAGGDSIEFDSHDDLPSGWNLLRNRLNPFGRRIPAPAISKILVGATLLSSNQYLDRLLEEGHVDLFLKPPVESFELLGFGEYQRLYEIGYESARDALAKTEFAAAARSGDP